ncbi:MAG: MFS transporter [Candidatus Pacearchaeota archaeon]
MQLKHFPFRYLKIPKEYKNLPKSIKIASLIFFSYNLGWGIVTAYYAIYLKNVLGSYYNIGYIIGVYHLTCIITNFVFSVLLDKINKRKIIRLILIFYFPFSYIFLKISTLIMFLFFVMYHGFIATALWISGEAYIRKHSPKNRAIESIAYFDLSYFISLIIGCFLGVFLISTYKFNIFYSISFFAFIAFLFTIFLPDKEKTFVNINIFKEIKKEIKNIKNNKRLKQLGFILFLFIFIQGIAGLIIPLFLNEMKVELYQIGIIVAISYLPFLCEGFFALLKKRKQVVMTAIFSLFLFFSLLFFIKNIFIIFIINLLISICFSAIMPIIAGNLTEAMPKERMGELSGFVFVVRNIGFGVSGLVSGFIASSLGLNFNFAFSALVSIVLLYLSSKTKF